MLFLQMVIDTLFLCFCEDSNKNDGSPGREYFAPPTLLVSINEPFLWTLFCSNLDTYQTFRLS